MTAKSVWRLVAVVFAVPVVVLGFLVLFELIPVIVQICFTLLVGCLFYIGEVLTKISVNLESLLHGVLAVAVAVLALHLALRGWWRSSGRATERSWRLAWSAKLAAMVLLLFATSMAAIGLVRQVAWLWSLDDWTEAGYGYIRRPGRQIESLAHALALYQKETGKPLPRDLEVLFPVYLSSPMFLFTYSSATKDWQIADYFPDARGPDPQSTLLLADPSPYRGERAVFFADGKMKVLREEAYQALVREQVPLDRQRR